MSKAEPRQVARWQCPFCYWTRADRGVVTDHLTRCWRNPENRACLSCGHFDRGYCCRGASDECGCGGLPAWKCSAGLDITTGMARTDCERWSGG